MPDLGPHAAFIWSAYAIVALVVTALVGWIIVDGRRQRTLLSRLEAQLKPAATDERAP